ncbi:tetratricopeptide repeat protein, partial [Actinomadura darangshiensis]
FEEFAVRTPGLPPDLVALLRACFRPDPADRPDRMDELADALAAVYAQVTGGPYPRSRPVPATLLADGLSNQALSMLDLGHPAQAEALWERALEADPRNPHAVFNLGLHRWRAGRLTDAQLIAELQPVRAAHEGDWIGDHLLGLVHLERGDPAGAAALLRAAAERAPDAPEPAAALERARREAVPHPPVVLEGHTNTVNALAFADGTGIAVSGGQDDSSQPPPGSEGGTVRIWDLVGGRCVHTLPAHSGGLPGGVGAVTLSPCGRFMASAGAETLVIWDVRSGGLLHRIGDQGPRIVSLAFVPDGSLLVSATEKGAVRIWDTRDGRCVRTLQKDQDFDRGYDTAVAVTGEHVVKWEPTTARLRVWDAATGTLVRTASLPRMRVALAAGGRAALAVSESEQQLWDPVAGRQVKTVRFPIGRDARFTVSADGAWALTTGLQLWDLNAGRCLRTLPGNGSVSALPLLSRDGRHALTASAERSVHAWDLAHGGPLSPWSHARPRTAVELTNEADTVGLALARARGHVDAGHWAQAMAEVRAARSIPGHERNRDLLDLWRTAGRHGRRTDLMGAWQARELPDTERRGVSDGILSAGGLLAVQFSGWSIVWLVDVESGEHLHTLQVGGTSVGGMAFTPDGSRLLTGASDGKVRVWDVASGESVRVLSGHRAEVRTITVSPDGRLAASGDQHGVVRVWDLAKGKRRHVLKGEGGIVFDLRFGPGARTLLVGDFSRVVTLWELDGERAHILPGQRPAVMSTDGGTVVSCGHTVGTLWTADGTTGEGTGYVSGPSEELASIHVSADGGTATTIGPGNALRVWDLRTARLRHHLSDTATCLQAIDDRFAMTGEIDGTLRIWDVQSGRSLHSFRAHTTPVEWIALTTDARLAVSRTRDQMRVWELDWNYTH